MITHDAKVPDKVLGNIANSLFELVNHTYAKRDEHYKNKKNTAEWEHAEIGMKMSCDTAKDMFLDFVNSVEMEWFADTPKKIVTKLLRKRYQESNGVFYLDAEIFTNTGGYGVCKFYYSKNTNGKWKLTNNSEYELPYMQDDIRDKFLTTVITMMWDGEKVVTVNVDYKGEKQNLLLQFISKLKGFFK